MPVAPTGLDIAHGGDHRPALRHRLLGERWDGPAIRETAKRNGEERLARL